MSNASGDTTTDTSETTELVLGQTYTDRYKKITGPALEIAASAGGCFLVGIQLPPKEDGDPGKELYCFDSHLDDEAGNPVRRPDDIARRADEILGKKFRDQASNLTGTATGVRFMENGTEQIAIQPKGDGKELPKAWNIDSILLEEIPEARPVAAAPRTGAPNSPSPRF